jgi:hypothetical protein
VGVLDPLSRAHEHQDQLEDLAQALALETIKVDWRTWRYGSMYVQRFGHLYKNKYN